MRSQIWRIESILENVGWIVVTLCRFRFRRSYPAAPLEHATQPKILTREKKRSDEGDANAIAVRRQGGVDNGDDDDGKDYRAPSNIEGVDTSF